MTNSKSVRIEVTRMLDSDEKSKLILQVLEVDWPTAIAVVPAALKAMANENATPDGIEILRASLNSYRESYGTPDRNRLDAFITPLIDGLTKLLLSEPPKVRAIKEIEEGLLVAMGEERFKKVRQLVIDYLMPPESSIGRVYASINRG
jgi:hypothetical protein